MVDIGRAIEFVERQGNAIERARLAHIARGEAPSQAAIDAIAGLQNPDGGFTYVFENRSVSTISDTVWVMLWLDDMGLTAGNIVDSVVSFLEERQREDGGWDETEEILKLNPPIWLRPGRLATRTYLSAYCTHVLLRFGQTNAAGIDYLMAHLADSGRLAGYERATWMALPALSVRPGRSSEVFCNALAYVEQQFTPDWEGSYLAWMLRCLANAEVPAHHALVQRALEALSRWQRHDGAWDGEDAPRFDVTSTIDAVRALKSYGRL